MACVAETEIEPATQKHGKHSSSRRPQRASDQNLGRASGRMSVVSARAVRLCVIIKMRRLDMFSKCCECLALALTLAACQISAEDPNETATELAVRDGRLRFPD